MYPTERITVLYVDSEQSQVEKFRKLFSNDFRIYASPHFSLKHPFSDRPVVVIAMYRGDDRIFSYFSALAQIYPDVSRILCVPTEVHEQLCYRIFQGEVSACVHYPLDRDEMLNAVSSVVSGVRLRSKYKFIPENALFFREKQESCGEFSVFTICWEATRVVIKKVNNAFVEVFGYEPKQIEEQAVRKLLGVKSNFEIIRDILSVASENRPVKRGLVLYTQQQQAVWCMLSVVPLYHINGQRHFHCICELVARQNYRQAFFNTAVSAIEDPALVVCQDGSIEAINTKTDQLLNCAGESIIGRKIEQFVSTEFLSSLLFFQQQASCCQKSYPVMKFSASLFENHKTRDEEFVDICLIPLMADDQVYMLAVLSVKSRIQKVMKVVRNVRHKYKTVFNSLQDAVFIVSEEDLFLEVNDEFAKRQAIDKSQLINHTAEELGLKFPWESTALLLKGKEKIFTELYKWIRKDKDGNELITEVSVLSIDYEGRKALLCISRNITEKIKAQKKLRQSDLRFKTLVNSLNEIVFTLDTSLRITGLYGNWKKFSSFLKESMSGQKLQDVFQAMPYSDLRKFAEPLRGKSLVFEWKYIEEHGVEVYLQFSLAPTYGERGQIIGITGIIRDVTTLKAAEKSIRESNERLEERVKERTQELQKANEESQKNENNALLLKEIVSTVNAASRSVEILRESLRILCDYAGFSVGYIYPAGKKQLFIAQRKRWYFKEKTCGLFWKRIEEELGDFLREKVNEVVESRQTSWGRVEASAVNTMDEYVSLLKSLVAFPVMLGENIVAVMICFSKSDIEIEAGFYSVIRQVRDQISYALLRKKTEKALHETKERYRLLSDFLPQAVFEMDIEQRITYFNKSFSDLFDFREYDLKKKKAKDLMLPEQYDMIEAEIRNLIRNREMFCVSSECIVKTSSGQEISVMAYISPIIVRKNVMGFRGILADISLLKQTQEELSQARILAERASKAKSEFLSNMSHEIRTPLNAVLGFAELLANSTTDPLSKNYISSLQSSGKTLLTLLNDILDFSKIEAGKLSLNFQYISIKAFLDELRKLFFLPARKKGLDLLFEIDGGNPDLIQIDDLRLKQVLINLLNNAIKFTDSGCVLLKVSFPEVPLDVGFGSFKGDLEILVEDTGIGIPEEQQQKVFDVFTQRENQDTKRYGGVGLGLSIARNLVQMMNGTLELESMPDKGSRFLICLHQLSFRMEKKRQLQEKVKSSANVFFRESVVLVVDDDPSNRIYLTATLENKNVQVIEAGDGREALQKCIERKPDLIVTDLKMPRMNGFELIEELRRYPEFEKIPVIAATASVLPSTIEQIKESGFDDFLLKPIHVKEFYRKVKKFLNAEDKAIEVAIENEFKPTVFEQQNSSVILEKLKGKFAKMAAELKEQKSVNQMGTFAKELKSLAGENEAPYLAAYVKTLDDAILTFDVAQMLESIDSYPGLVRFYENIAENSSEC